MGGLPGSGELGMVLRRRRGSREGEVGRGEGPDSEPGAPSGGSRDPETEPSLRLSFSSCQVAVGTVPPSRVAGGRNDAGAPLGPGRWASSPECQALELVTERLLCARLGGLQGEGEE